MRLRVTIEAVVELTPGRALEKFGSTDPFAVAHKMQHGFNERRAEENTEEMSFVGCTVLPIYG